MALVMGMMGCVRSWGGRCRRRHSEIANVVSVTGVHMSSDLVEIGRATCKDGCMLMGPVSCSWTLSAAIAMRVWCAYHTSPMNKNRRPHPRGGSTSRGPAPRSCATVPSSQARLPRANDSERTRQS